MDKLGLADIESTSVAQHLGGAGALLDVVVAVEVEQPADRQIGESDCWVHVVAPSVNGFALCLTLLGSVSWAHLLA